MPRNSDPRKATWHDLLEHPCFRWTEPDPGLVRVAPGWRDEGRRLVYDLGCGAGRHMAYLQTLGFDVVGTDVSENALAACRERLQEVGLPRRLVRADMTASPFASEVFDAGVSTNVLNHNPRAVLDGAIADVGRVLKPGGEFYLTVLNTCDWRYGSGEEVEPDTFILAEGPETGILHHFFSEPDLRDWLSAFRLLDLQRLRDTTTLTLARGDEPVVRDAWAAWIRKAG